MRIRQRILLASFLSLPLLPARQIAVEGTVLDPSGRPVNGARVECAGRAAVTGLDGRFSLPGVQRCEATVSAPGFAPGRVSLLAAAPARIELALAVLAERIVVSATRRESSVEEAGVAANVVTGADFERRQFPMVSEALRELAGVHVARYGRPGSLTQVFARGAQRTGALVLIDGVPVNDPGGEVNLATLSSAFFERMEVVRGPESALFGAEAAAGVIQLFTRRGDPERRLPRGSLSYERGSFQTDRWVASLAGGSGARLDYALGAEQFHSVGEFPNDYFRNTSGSANVGLRFSPATQARVIFRGADAIVGTPNQVGYGIINYDARQMNRDALLAVRLDDARGRNYAQRLAFGYHRLRETFLDNGVGGPYTLAALVRDVATPAPRVHMVGLVDPNLPPSLIPAGTRFVKRNFAFWPSDPYVTLVSRRNLDYQGTLTGAGGATVFGYEYERQQGDITGREAGRDNHGLFAYRQHNVAGRVFLSGGVRLERNSVFGAKLAPRGAASFRVTGERGPLAQTFLRLSAGRGITEPSLLQNFARDPWYVGNPGLRPEKTASFEAGLVQEWFARRLRTEISAFDNYFRDLIVFVFLPFPEPSTWRNVEASRARGLEFSAETRLGSSLSLAGSYTRMRTRITRSSSPNSLFTGVGQELARRPGSSGAVSLSWMPRRFWFQTGAVLMGERQDQDLFGVTRNPGYQNVYAALTLRLHRRLSPFVRVDNVLNSRYHEVLGYSNLSRSVTGGLRVEW
ncbi:MAG: TonB-dependent receptor [Acidobacteriota bacterium]